MRLSAIIVVLALSLSIVVVASAQKGMRPVGKRPPDLPAEVYRTGWALLIGINDYPHLPPQHQLNYAVKDATDLAELLKTGFGFPEENITVITNAEATKIGITNALASFADPEKVSEEDCVLVFFSGHGQTVTLPRGGDMGFLVPYDADVDLSGQPNPAHYARYCIDMGKLKRDSELIPAKHILFIVDACYSGLALSGSKGLGSRLPGWRVRPPRSEGRNAAPPAAWGDRRSRPGYRAGDSPHPSTPHPRLSPSRPASPWSDFNGSGTDIYLLPYPRRGRRYGGQRRKYLSPRNQRLGR